MAKGSGRWQGGGEQWVGNKKCWVTNIFSGWVAKYFVDNLSKSFLGVGAANRLGWGLKKI